VQLCNTELLKETADTPPCYLPAYDIETLSLYDIIEAVRAAEENSLLSLDSIHTESPIQQIDEAINQALAQCLHGQSLRDLALADEDLADQPATEQASDPAKA
jgi:hypothetical protein